MIYTSARRPSIPSSVFVLFFNMRRSQDSDRNDLVTYTVEAIAVFKNSSKAEKERKKIKFTTTGSSAACGIDLEIDKTYLLDLVYNGRKLSAVGSCGGWQLWKEVSDDDKNVLRNGCGDPCKGECDKHQVCSRVCGKRFALPEILCSFWIEYGPVTGVPVVVIVLRLHSLLFLRNMRQALCLVLMDLLDQ